MSKELRMLKVEALVAAWADESALARFTCLCLRLCVFWDAGLRDESVSDDEYEQLVELLDQPWEKQTPQQREVADCVPAYLATMERDWPEHIRAIGQRIAQEFHADMAPLFGSEALPLPSEAEQCLQALVVFVRRVLAEEDFDDILAPILAYATS